jgi:hypothetical protein
MRSATCATRPISRRCDAVGAPPHWAISSARTAFSRRASALLPSLAGTRPAWEVAVIDAIHAYIVSRFVGATGNAQIWDESRIWLKLLFGFLPPIRGDSFQAERIKDFAARFSGAMQHGVDELLRNASKFGKSGLATMGFAGSTEKFSDSICFHVIDITTFLL